ncbi:MAG: pitrilysin family protein [Pseudomonadota bacterium]
MSEVRTTTLDNGITVVTETMPHLHSTALGLWVRSGSRAEHEGEHGIAHLLEHMAFKGTETRSARDIAEEIEAVGGDLNAVTSFEATAYYARVLEDDVDLGLDLLGDITLNARFDPTELQREQHVIEQEILNAHDTPDDLVFDQLQELSFPDQTLGRSILGSPESVRAFRPSDLKLFQERTYTSDRMVLSVAGAVDHDRVVDYATRVFQDTRVTPFDEIPRAAFSGGYRGIARKIEQVHLTLGFQGCPYHDQGVFAAQILATVLGGGMSSRLFQEVREKRGLCYGVYSYHWSVSDAGMFGIYAATGPSDVNDLLTVVFDELAGVGQTVTEQEVGRAKAQLKAGLLMSLESPSARIEQMARHLAVHGRIVPTSEIVERIDAVTAEDVMAIANSLFREKACAIAAVGPKAGLKAVEKFARNQPAPRDLVDA